MSEKKKEREEDVDNNNDVNNKKTKFIDPEIQQAGKKYLEELVHDIMKGVVSDCDVNPILGDFFVIAELFVINKKFVKEMLKPMIIQLVKEKECASSPLIERLKILKEYL